MKNNNYKNQLSSGISKVGIFCLVLLACIMMNLSSSAQTIFNSSGTYTVPPGVTSINLYLYGGGGAGAGNAYAPNCFDNGGGGGGGACVVSTAIPVVPGNTYTITIGAGDRKSTRL